MKRVDALAELAAVTTSDDLFIGSVGAVRDDWWNLGPGFSNGLHNTFFPAVLGSVTPTALGLALAAPQRRVVALDSDGSMLMNTGVLCALGRERPSNLSVIIFDNEVYESTGAIPTHTGAHTDLARMADAAGCLNCFTARIPSELRALSQAILEDHECGLLVVKVEPGVQDWSMRQRWPFDGMENKYRFRRYVRNWAKGLAE